MDSKLNELSRSNPSLTPMKQTKEFLSHIVLLGFRMDGGHSASFPSQKAVFLQPLSSLHLFPNEKVQLAVQQGPLEGLH